MKNIYFISDTHLYHENILKLGAGRPFFDLKHMHANIRLNWCKTVNPEDDIYLQGDIAMGNFEESIKFFDDLPGNKFFIPGNHDKIFSNNSKTHIAKFTPLYEQAGFTILPEITHIMVPVSWGEQKVLLSHFPYGEPFINGRVDKYAKVRPKNEGLPLVHGHTHSQYKFDDNEPLQFNIGVDANNFTPVNLTEIVEWLEELKKSDII